MTVDELEARWRALGPEPRGRGTVALVCLRKGQDVHACPASIEVTPDGGVLGDRWSSGLAPDRERQLTLMSVRVATLVADGRAPLHLAGDNVLVDLDLAAAALPAGTRLEVGTAVVVVSAVPHTGCKKFAARFGAEALAWTQADPGRRLRGINCRVERAGRISVGDPIAVVA